MLNVMREFFEKFCVTGISLVLLPPVLNSFLTAALSNVLAQPNAVTLTVKLPLRFPGWTRRGRFRLCRQWQPCRVRNSSAGMCPRGQE